MVGISSSLFCQDELVDLVICVHVSTIQYPIEGNRINHLVIFIINYFDVISHAAMRKRIVS